jgi:hypothetical protein
MPYYDDELTDRAVELHFRWCRRDDGSVDHGRGEPMQPNRHDTHRDGDLITIAGGNRVLGRYRVLPGDRLRRLAPRDDD